ncbi:MAG TPA: DUF222 domain-containing protein [Jatrophihabitans sp.]|nr:DUF222 domain-containing protein [Jatrophihabitans sp.]
MDDWPDGLTDSELLACAVAEHPAFRTGAELDRIDPAGSSAGERVDLLAVLEEQRRWLDVAQLRLLAAMQAGDSTELGLGQEVVSLALQLPLRTAPTKLAQATTLVTELPRTLAAVSAGSISAAHADVLAEAVWRLPADPALPAALEDTVLPPVLAAGCVTVPQLRRRVRRAVLALDPATAEARHQRAVTERRVEYHPGEDGMASLTVFLAAPEAQLLYSRLTTATGLLPTQDPRTLDQQRADLFVDAVLSALPPDALPTVQGRRPAIQVVVCADTPPAPGAGCSPTPTPAHCSTSAHTATAHPNDCANTQPPATTPASFPPANNRPTAANPTTPCRSTTAGAPGGTTSPPPADATTEPRPPAPAGPTATTPTPATPGPPPPATTTPTPQPEPGRQRAIKRPPPADKRGPGRRTKTTRHRSDHKGKTGRTTARRRSDGPRA